MIDKNVLIIGANGFVGNYLIKEFIDNKYNVIACDIAEKLQYDYSVQYEKLNILDKEKVSEVIKKYNPEYIINLAAISSVGLSWKIPADTMNVNIIGTINVLEAAKENKDCKILLIGSSEEYIQKQEPLKESDELDANNPYGISKVAQENIAKMYAKRYGMNIVCTRSFNHTGIGQAENFVIPSFCKQVAEIEKSGQDGKIYVGNLQAYRDISDVRDIVKVYRKLLEIENTEIVYNVGSGKSYKIEELLKYIISLSNQKIDIMVDESKIRNVDTPYICADNTRIKEYFDGTDIMDTIKEMYQYYLNK